MKMTKESNSNGTKASDALMRLNEYDAGGKDSSSSSGSDSEDAVREPWARKTEYILSTIGYCVGLGNVWRFPYICMRNGGGAFFIPFFLSLFICAMPAYFLEVAMGQFNGKSSFHVWKICPLFQGIGYSTNLMSVFVTWYYSMVLAWSLIYLVNSFKSPLPWTLCGQPWNSENCVTPGEKYNTMNTTQPIMNSIAANVSNLLGSNKSLITGNLNSTLAMGNPINDVLINGTMINGTTSSVAVNDKIASAEEFWLYNVLDISPGLGVMGGLNWYTTLALCITNLLILLTIIRGIRSSGKVVYVTATLPYLLIAIILINGLTMEGALDGVVYYIKPDFQKLAKFQTWVEASIQVFYSLGPGWGGLATMASYNKFNNNCMRDSILLTIICEGTSIFAGFAIFSVLGHMAHTAQVSVESFAKSGAGLAFIVYPEAVSYLPVPQLWGVLFFIMLFTVGMDSQFTNVETVITSISDQWPIVLKKRTVVSIAAMVIFTLSSIVFCTRGGMYVFQLADWYIGAFTLMIQCVLEFIVVAWIYGTDRFCRDIEMMIGKKPPMFFVVTWKFISPAMVLALFLVTLATYKPPVYAGYVYPLAAEICGWIYAVGPFSSVVIVAVYQLLKRKGSFMQRVRSALVPSSEWGPADPKLRATYHYEMNTLHNGPVERV